MPGKSVGSVGQASVGNVRLSRDYALPKVVSTLLEASIQQANPIVIVVELASFTQIVNGVNPKSIDPSSVSWGALLVLLYGAIMLSIAGSFLSLIVIKMCSDLPLAAQQKILSERLEANKPLTHVAGGGLLSEYVLANQYLLLQTFGMSTSYKLVVRMSDLVLIAACVCTFAAFTFWVFLSETIITAGVTMVFFGFAAIIVIFAYTIAGNGQRWS